MFRGAATSSKTTFCRMTFDILHQYILYLYDLHYETRNAMKSTTKIEENCQILEPRAEQKFCTYIFSPFSIFFHNNRVSCASSVVGKNSYKLFALIFMIEIVKFIFFLFFLFLNFLETSCLYKRADESELTLRLILLQLLHSA